MTCSALARRLVYSSMVAFAVLLCGAVVAMKVMEALYEKMAPEVDLVDKMLPFAGIATIGDVMDLQDENRILVKEGLQRLHHTTNLGLQELIRVFISFVNNNRRNIKDFIRQNHLKLFLCI